MHGHHVVVPSLDIFLEELVMLESAAQPKSHSGASRKRLSSIVKGDAGVLDLDMAKFRKSPRLHLVLTNIV